MPLSSWCPCLFGAKGQPISRRNAAAVKTDPLASFRAPAQEAEPEPDTPFPMWHYMTGNLPVDEESGPMFHTPSPSFAPYFCRGPVIINGIEMDDLWALVKDPDHQCRMFVNINDGTVLRDSEPEPLFPPYVSFLEIAEWHRKQVQEHAPAWEEPWKKPPVRTAEDSKGDDRRLPSGSFGSLDMSDGQRSPFAPPAAPDGVDFTLNITAAYRRGRPNSARKLLVAQGSGRDVMLVSPREMLSPASMRMMPIPSEEASPASVSPSLTRSSSAAEPTPPPTPPLPPLPPLSHDHVVMQLTPAAPPPPPPPLPEEDSR